ncbi:MAG TPA: Crp/Fnr family transcriptional regulator [Actinomycetota bacterium]|nr:Crp/Fnr family transcriptional regulator [Actinomycetota bacterium]
MGVPAAGGFLGRLTDADSADLMSIGRRQSFETDATLLTEGERSDRLVLLLSGRVKLSNFTEDGREVLLGIRDPGDLLGELSAMDGQPRSACVTAIEPSEGLVITGASFRSFLERSPKAAVALLEMVIGRLRDADLKRIEFSAYDTVGRVARRLVEMADRFGTRGSEGLEIAVALSQDDLAGWVGCSREAAAKALRLLRDEGLVRTGRRSITIVDHDALVERSR